MLGVIRATPEAVLNAKSASEAFVKRARVPSAPETVSGAEGLVVPIPTLLFEESTTKVDVSTVKLADIFTSPTISTGTDGEAVPRPTRELELSTTKVGESKATSLDPTVKVPGIVMLPESFALVTVPSLGVPMFTGFIT